MELRSCYFCGAAGRTVGARTVGDARVALCPACDGKLARLRRAAGDDGERVPPVTLDRDGETTDEEEVDGPSTISCGDSDDSDDPPTGLRGLGASERGDSDYRRALRLLGNREFPIARTAAVDLVAGAYDLDRSECERLVDLTVERGLLEEVDGELRRG